MSALKGIAIAPTALIGLLALLVGCNTLRPLWEGKGLDGYPAKNISIVVPETYSFTPGTMTHTLPAGTYSFVSENYEGVFFQSPNKISLAGQTGTSLGDGGLFFKEGASTDIYEYIINSQGYYTLRKLPEDFKFSVERKPR